MKQTPLHDEHLRLGARMVPFAGFSMPVQYAGILKEHDAVRHRAGLFDLSHMGQFELRGEGVAAFADALTVNNVATMKPLQARYNLFCNAAGGVHDDVIFYRLPDRWLLVVNASNADKMWQLLVAANHAGDVRLESHHGARALIAIQGPRAVAMLAKHAAAEIAALGYYTCLETQVLGEDVVVARTGYTGEDGFEIFCDGAAAPRIWRTLLEREAAEGLEPAGLGARDVLRLEAGMPLYGFELDEAVSPVAGGQRWAVKPGKGAFVGREALVAEIEGDAYDRIVGVVLEGRVPARHGYAVYAGNERVGEIRSASLAPSAGGAQVATALVHAHASAVGTPLGVEVRGTRHAARVAPLPFYKRR